MEELIFKREWLKIDVAGKYYMSVEDAPLFMTNLGIPIPPDELQRLIKEEWKPNEANMLDYYVVLRWFRRFSADGDEHTNDDVIDFEKEEEDQKEKKKREKKEKKEREKEEKAKGGKKSIQLTDLRDEPAEFSDEGNNPGADNPPQKTEKSGKKSPEKKTAASKKGVI